MAAPRIVGGRNRRKGRRRSWLPAGQQPGGYSWLGFGFGLGFGFSSGVIANPKQPSRVRIVLRHKPVPVACRGMTLQQAVSLAKYARHRS